MGSGKARKLTVKQRLFIAEYQKNPDATKAAIKAGYSRKSAAYIGHELLQKTLVKKELQGKLAKRLSRADVTADFVLTELRRIGGFDIRKLYRPDGSMKLPHEWDDDTAAAVASVEALEEYDGQGKERKFVGFTKKVRAHEKKGALELLGKHLKLFTEKVEMSGAGGGPVTFKVVYDEKLPQGAEEP